VFMCDNSIVLLAQEFISQEVVGQGTYFNGVISWEFGSWLVIG
jgi:hypothetical protein